MTLISIGDSNEIQLQIFKYANDNIINLNCKYCSSIQCQ